MRITFLITILSWIIFYYLKIRKNRKIFRKLLILDLRNMECKMLIHKDLSGKIEINSILLLKLWTFWKAMNKLFVRKNLMSLPWECAYLKLFSSNMPIKEIRVLMLLEMIYILSMHITISLWNFGKRFFKKNPLLIL
jgi:hypothetical protein